MNQHIRNITEATEARSRAATQLQAMYDQAEGRELTPEERRAEGQHKAAIKDADATITRAVTTLENEDRNADLLERMGVFDSAENRSASEAATALAPSAQEYRSLTSSNVGAALIPKEHSATVIEQIERRSRVVGLAQKFRTTSDTFVFPVVTAGVEANVVAEGATIPTDDPDVDPVTANIVKTAIRTQLTLEAYEDADPSSRAVTTSQHIRAHSRKWDALALLGTGTGEPTGVVNHANIATTTARAAPSLDIVHASISRLVATGLDPEELVAVLPAAVWTALEGAKDSNSRYLLTDPGNAAERRIFGVPVVLSDALPVDGGAGTNEATLVVGAWDYAGLVAREDATRVEVSPHYAWAESIVDVRSICVWASPSSIGRLRRGRRTHPVVTVAGPLTR